MDKRTIVFNVIIAPSAVLREPKLISGGDCSCRLPKLGLRDWKPRITVRCSFETMLVEAVVGTVAHGCYLDTVNLVKSREKHQRLLDGLLGN